MEINAWIQMGSERRETTIVIPEEEFESVKEAAEEGGLCLESRLEEYVKDWLFAQYGWGWSGAGFEVGCGFMENFESGGAGCFAVTSRSSIPNTKAIRFGISS